MGKETLWIAGHTNQTKESTTIHHSAAFESGQQTIKREMVQLLYTLPKLIMHELCIMSLNNQGSHVVFTSQERQLLHLNCCCTVFKNYMKNVSFEFSLSRLSQNFSQFSIFLALISLHSPYVVICNMRLFKWFWNTLWAVVVVSLCFQNVQCIFHWQ